MQRFTAQGGFPRYISIPAQSTVNSSSKIKEVDVEKRLKKALDCKEKKEYQKAIEIWRLLAQHGIPEARMELGCLYRDGVGVEQNYQRAFEYFTDVPQAQGEHAITSPAYACVLAAYHNIGLLFYHGHLGKIDHAEALKNFTIAADSGYGPALIAVGLMHYLGHGVTGNIEMARQYFEQALVAKQAIANVHLGALYFDCANTVSQLQEKKSFAIKSLTCYKSAVDFGVVLPPKAYLNMADLYEKGLAANSNPKLDLELANKCYQSALNLFKTMAEEGKDTFQQIADVIDKLDVLNERMVKLSSSANSSISSSEMNKQGSDNFITLLTRSADSGNPGAQLQLGIMYMDGVQVAKNNALAVKYLTLAYQTAQDEQRAEIASKNAQDEQFEGNSSSTAKEILPGIAFRLGKLSTDESIQRRWYERAYGQCKDATYALACLDITAWNAQSQSSGIFKQQVDLMERKLKINTIEARLKTAYKLGHPDAGYTTSKWFAAQGNQTQAEFWLTLALKKGNPKAQTEQQNIEKQKQQERQKLEQTKQLEKAVQEKLEKEKEDRRAQQVKQIIEGGDRELEESDEGSDDL